MHVFQKLFLTAIASSVVVLAQNPITADSPFQVRYASNLTSGDSVINITNTGATGAAINGPGIGAQPGDICVNVYALDPTEELVSCCSCNVTPDGLVSLSVIGDLTSNTQTGVKPSSVVIKLVATANPGGGACTNSAAMVDTGTLVPGLAAWGTTIHAAPGGGFGVTETAFTPSTLSAGERSSLANRCTGIIGNSSSFGVCGSCRTGGLGGGKSKL